MAETKKQSETARAFSEDGALKTHVGGQALLEGIMMRGKLNWAVAVREPEGGIYLEEHDLLAPEKGILDLPVLRGVRAFVASLVLGYKALSISAEHAFPDADPDDPEASYELDDKAMAFALVLGIVLGVALFIALPAFLTNLIVGEYDSNMLVWNLVDGAIRIVIFVFYIWLVGRMDEMKRMFGYHGAEHKTIHCFEHGLELTPENARNFPCLHVRCGTAFLIMVMILAIIIYTLVPVKSLIDAWGVPAGLPKLVLVIVIRILLMPLIAGITYEITVKWAGERPENPLVKVILWPGLQMQRLTTNEPDDGQLECAIAAMKRVLEREKAAEAAE